MLLSIITCTPPSHQSISHNQSIIHNHITSHHIKQQSYIIKSFASYILLQYNPNSTARMDNSGQSSEDEDFVEPPSYSQSRQAFKARFEKEEFKKLMKSPKKKVLKTKSEGEATKKREFQYIYSQSEQFMLGAGSFGKVFICYYNGSSKVKLALKIVEIPAKYEMVREIEQIVATTKQEIRSLLQLRSNPNIIKIEDLIVEIGDSQGYANSKSSKAAGSRIYMILEYCDNKDLASYFKKLREEGMLKKEEEVLRYFKQIVNAFKDLYRLNIIHKDIKPGNILVDGDVLKVADFGLSKQVFQKNEKFFEEHFGTVTTAAPQILFREPYTNKCDIYSLGVTLYWMFFSCFPFRENCPREELTNLKPIFQRDCDIKLSKETLDLLRQMLAFHENDRIGWPDLFAHRYFQNRAEDEGYARVTRIGRELGEDMSDSRRLDQAIPEQFYAYINEGDDKWKEYYLRQSRKSSGQAVEEVEQAFKKIFLEVTNQKFLINFLKELLNELWAFEISEKSSRKADFSLMKDIGRLGIDRYILHLYTTLYNELAEKQVCRILDTRALKLVNKREEFSLFVRDYSKEMDSYQAGTKKAKLTPEQADQLTKRAEEFQVSHQFNTLLYKKKSSDIAAVLLQLQKAVIELIYFIKPEAKQLFANAKTLSEHQTKKYRSCILMVHHLYMFLMHGEVFPHRYDPNMLYDIELYNKEEKYADKKKFTFLANTVLQILERFES